MKTLWMFILTTILFMQAKAQSCNCSVTISAPTSGSLAGIIDYNANVIKPGKTLCIQAGTYRRITINNLTGKADSIIRIINCGGIVKLRDSTETYTGMNIRASKYFNLSGTGHTSKYGFRIEMTKPGASALNIIVKSTNCEIDHVEVAGFRLSGGRYSIGSSGIVAKTDPVYCDPSTWRPNFTMYDVKIHDNYIHNVTNEGMYIGNTAWSSGRTGTCNGQTVTAYPHAILGLQIYNNKVDSTGWDGLQYACSPDAQVHHNIVTRAGLSQAQDQDNGIQIGGGAGGSMYNNTINANQGLKTKM